MSRPPRHVVVFTRRNCGLCRQAEELVAELVARRTEVTLVDVDANDDLLRRYHLRVPVIEVDGVEVAAAPIDHAAVRAALRGGRGFWSRRLRS